MGCATACPTRSATTLAQGHVVVANLSRRSLGEAAATFGTLHVVAVTARPEILLARLVARGRETEDTVRARLLREVSPVLPAETASHLRLDNSGDVEAATERVVGYLNGIGGWG